MYGVDVSNNNKPEILLADVRPKPQFVIAKCTEGNYFVDDTYADYANKAHVIGAQFGAYHYFKPKINGATQGLYFAAHARPRTRLSAWIDYEEYGATAQEDAEGLASFISAVKHEFPKQKVGLYFNMTGYRRLLPFLGKIGHSAIWFADDNGEAGSPTLGEWNIHQYKFGPSAEFPNYDFSNWTEQELCDFFTW